MKNLLLDYWNDENGQTSTEYILLVAVVVIIVMKFKKEAKDQLGDLTGQIFGNSKTLANEMMQEANQ